MKTTMKKLLFLAVPLLFLGGCSTAPEVFTEIISGMVQNGSITPEQGTAVVQAFDTAATSENWWEPILSVLGGALLASLGVRSRLPFIGRGAPTQKVGLPASMVKS